MLYQPQSILLESPSKFGKRPPVEFCGNVFRRIQPLMTHSVRMAFEGRSAAMGAPPEWLKRAADVRILGFAEQNGNTLLQLEAPALGEAAEELYKQGKLWNDLPAPADTAVNVMARVINDVRNQNPDSPRYDPSLLRVTYHLSPLFVRDLKSIRCPETLRDFELRAVIDRDVPARAHELSNRTPSPRQVRVVGTLDMMRYSTRAFALKLQDGKEVCGVLEHPASMEELSTFLNRKVLIIGKAIYRPSGSLLRIDANHFEEPDEQSRLFYRVPPPIATAPDMPKLRVSDTSKGIAAFFGIWPGEESDAELLAALQDLRG
jgi:hypothetical protein